MQGAVLAERRVVANRPDILAVTRLEVAAEESLLFALPNEIRRDLKARDGKDVGSVRHDASFSEDGSLH